MRGWREEVEVVEGEEGGEMHAEREGGGEEV